MPASLDEVVPLAQAGADFIALGDWIWTQPQAPPPRSRRRRALARRSRKPDWIRCGAARVRSSRTRPGAAENSASAASCGHRLRGDEPQSSRARRLRHALRRRADRRPRAAEPDLAFGAFQRGYYLTAFELATNRVEQNDDPKAMTLLGELYANGLGVPQNDTKAADWYKLAAARGDREAMFALAMFALCRAAPARATATRAPNGSPPPPSSAIPLAAYDLALLYIEGQLFPQDFNRAAELFAPPPTPATRKRNTRSAPSTRRAAACRRTCTRRCKLWAQAALADNADAEVEYAIALYQRRRRRQGRARPPPPDLPQGGAARATRSRRTAWRAFSPTGRGAPHNPVEAAKWH